MPGGPRLLSGWGHTAPSTATALVPDRTVLVEACLRRLNDQTDPRPGSPSGPRPHPRLIARGLGRSYGDAAQCAGGTVVELTSLDRLREADWGIGRIRVDAGISLATIMRASVPRGWFVAVTPGTRMVSVGGAIAADIHGKNHHRDGSFAHKVLAITMATPAGTVSISRESDPELWWATFGGMGLTGIVLEATLQLIPIETSLVAVDTERARDLDDLMARMEADDHRYRYSVAWVDTTARGRHFGRGVLTRGDHAPLSDVPRQRRKEAHTYAPRPPLPLPPGLPNGMVNAATIRAFNELWYAKTPQTRLGELQSLTRFFHPLDGVGHWYRVYGPRGFLQYQFVVPDAAAVLVGHAIRRLTDAGPGSALVVLKRFGAATPGPLSFPLQGWTLAVDIPLGSPRLAATLDELDDAVVAAGGRVYLAKDSRMRPELVPLMYPEIDRWRATCRRVDPRGILSSDLARRLRLRQPPGETDPHHDHEEPSTP